MQMQPYDTIVQNFITRNDITAERYWNQSEGYPIPEVEMIDHLVEQMSPEDIFGLLWQADLSSRDLSKTMSLVGPIREEMRDQVVRLLTLELERRFPKPPPRNPVGL
jgi:hypothetical protein